MIQDGFTLGEYNSRSGIYALVNTENNKVYIGKSIRTFGRVDGHINGSTSPEMIEDYERHGLDAFVFLHLLTAPQDSHSAYENLVIAYLMMYGIELYNKVDSPNGKLLKKIEDSMDGLEGRNPEELAEILERIKGFLE